MWEDMRPEDTKSGINKDKDQRLIRIYCPNVYAMDTVCSDGLYTVSRREAIMKAAILRRTGRNPYH